MPNKDGSFNLIPRLEGWLADSAPLKFRPQSDKTCEIRHICRPHQYEYTRKILIEKHESGF